MHCALLSLAFCLTAFRFVVHRRVRERDADSASSFNEGEKERAGSSLMREKKKTTTTTRKREKTSSTKLNRNDPQGRRSSVLLRTPLRYASSFEIFLRSCTAFIPNRLPSFTPTLVCKSLCKKPVNKFLLARNSNDDLFKWEILFPIECACSDTEILFRNYA